MKRIGESATRLSSVVSGCWRRASAGRCDIGAGVVSAACAPRRGLAACVAIGLVLCAMATVLSLSLCVPGAWANRVLDAPVDVSDDVTRVHVAKLDSVTHEYVKGASMVILEEVSGVSEMPVVDSWTSDGSVHELEKVLDVNKTYILRELQAPDGYDRVADVRFTVNPTEGAGITVLTSDSGEWELSESYKITLYDPPASTPDERVIVRTRDNPGSPDNPEKPKAPAPRTGDETPLALVGALALAAALAIVALQLAKRRLS